MKKLYLILICTIILLTGFSENSFCKRKNTYSDFGLFYGSKPKDGMSGLYGFAGFGGGITVELADMDPVMLALRADIGWYLWKLERGHVDGMYWRIPIFLGARFNFYFVKFMTPYLEAGPELSFGMSTDEDFIKGGTNFGVSFGGGIDFNITKYWFLGANFRYHAIKNPYFSLGPVIGGRF